jgi:hypothetical protein
VDRIQPIGREDRILPLTPVHRRVPARRDEDERPRDDHEPSDHREDPPPDDDHPHVDVRA